MGWIIVSFNLVVTIDSVCQASKNKMIIFQFVREFYQTHGILLPKSNDYCSFNRRNSFYLFTMFSMVTSSTAFLICRAKTVIEYTITFYASITLLTCIGHLISSLWKIPTIMQLIDKVQTVFDGSKSILTVFHPTQWWIERLKPFIFIYKKSKGRVIIRH